VQGLVVFHYFLSCWVISARPGTKI